MNLKLSTPYAYREQRPPPKTVPRV